ncbi:MAG: NAD-dependent epimerase/dehydratase family protein [Pseudomonadales bacterium]
MRVLVTGGTGFVGSHVTRQLLGLGHAVQLLVRDEGKARSVYSQAGTSMLSLKRGDVTDAASVRSAIVGCDAVVHAAAATPIKGDDTAVLFKTNVDGVKHVIGTAADVGIRRIVHVSSITAIFNTDASKVTEQAPLSPSRMPYGRSKVEADMAVREMQNNGAAVDIVYPGGVIGPNDPGLSDAFKALIHRFNDGFRITEGGMQHVDVRDLASFIVTLLEESTSGARYLLPGPYLTWSQLADLLEKVSGYTLKRVPAKGWVFRAMGRFYDFRRLFTTVDSPISAETMRYSTQWPNVKPSEKFTELGLSFCDPEKTFADSLCWLVEAGHLQKQQLPRLFPQG